MRKWWTAHDFVALPGMPKTFNGVNRCISRQNWRAVTAADGTPLARTRKSNGGRPATEYHISLLPDEARAALIAKLARDEAAKAAVSSRSVKPQNSTRVPSVQGPSALACSSSQENSSNTSPEEASVRDARLAVLVAFERFEAQAGLARTLAEQSYVALYNEGVQTPDRWIRVALPSISVRSLQRWRRARDKENMPTGRHGGGRVTGRSILARANDGELAELVTGLLVAQPFLTAHHIRTVALKRLGKTVAVRDPATSETCDVKMPKIRAFQVFIKRFKAEHKNPLMAIQDPDGYKNEIRLTGGSQNAGISRLNELWEIDASPADVLCTDGRHSIVALLDIFSRRVMVLVTKTPKSSANLLLIRKAILAWGVPETIRTDNGSDFTSHWVRRAIVGLGIFQDVCAPFSPEQKGSVERVIGTMQRDLMAGMPGFIGHSVADRSKIEARKAFAQRLGESDEHAFAVGLSAQDVQAHIDRWCSAAYGNRKHSAISMSPNAKARSYTEPVKRIEDEAVLRLLLAPVAGKDGVRSVTKRGLRIDGRFYLSASLDPGEKVLVRHDPQDMGRVYAFSPDGTDFICEAINPDLMGIDPAQFTLTERKMHEERMGEAKKALRAAARKVKRGDVVEDILAQGEAESATVVDFTPKSEPYVNPQIDAAARVAGRYEPSEMSDAEKVRMAELEREAAGTAPKKTAKAVPKSGEVVALKPEKWRPPKDDQERFLLALECELRLEIGQQITPAQAKWMRGYRNTPEYRTRMRLKDDFSLEDLIGHDGMKALEEAGLLENRDGDLLKNALG